MIGVAFLAREWTHLQMLCSIAKRVCIMTRWIISTLRVPCSCPSATPLKRLLQDSTRVPREVPKSSHSQKKQPKSDHRICIGRNRPTNADKVAPKPQNIGFRSRVNAIRQDRTNLKNERKSLPKSSQMAPKLSQNCEKAVSRGTAVRKDGESGSQGRPMHPKACKRGLARERKA